MKILCISDTHTKHNQIPKEWLENKNGIIDTIIHGGDVSSRGYKHEINNFLEWFDGLDYKHKILIAGNHDFGFQRFNADYDEVMSLLKTYPNITYLMDSEIVIDGVKFFGSPWQPEFYNWAFNLRRGAPLRDKWEQIPLDTDVLITHGGPKNIGRLNVTQKGEDVGCEDLYYRLPQLKSLSLFIQGHIHEGYGFYRFVDGQTFVNASTLNINYEIKNKPILITLDDISKKVISIE